MQKQFMREANMEIKKEYQSIFDLVNQIISHTNDLISASSCQDKTLLEDIVLTEMNDLLLGIENGQIYLADSRCLGSTYYVTDGAIQDKKLANLICTLQEELDKNKYVKKHGTGRLLEEILDGVLGLLVAPIVIFAVLAVFENPIFWGFLAGSIILLVVTIVARCFNAKNRTKWNYQLFPNLPYQNCLYVFMIEYKAEVILTIGYDHVEIDLGYIEDDDKYFITVATRNTGYYEIIEEIEAEKRYLVESVLLDVMNKYENHSFSN